MKNVFFLSCLIIIGIQVEIVAQSNSFLDEFLAKNKASAGEAAYLVLSIAGVVPETATTDDALAALKAKNWNLSFKETGAPITLGEYSYLIMKTYNIGGGLLYAIFPGPRYAGRELAYLGYIKGDTSPGRQISGKEAFSILRRVIETKEGA